MGLNCSCPLGQSIGGITVPTCKESLGQVQKVIFQRVNVANSTSGDDKLVSISATAIKSLTSMQALKSATGDTKIAVSPYLENPSTEPGAARTFGGGNQTLGGVEKIIGREPTKFTGVFYELPQSTIKQIKDLMCETIGVYLIDENGNIGCIQDTFDSETVYRPIPIGSLFVGDKKLGGYEETDSNSVEWNFYPNWSDDLVILKQDELGYNPLTQL